VLTRDVAYNTILPSKRREYHESIVRILEDEAAEGHNALLDELCMHSIHARAWAKAITYLQMAAAPRSSERATILPSFWPVPLACSAA
jgi:predicted ATPase